MYAVVRVGDYAESACNALRSVAANGKEFSQVYFVCPHYDPQKDPFPRYQECLSLLKEAHVPIEVVGQLDMSRLPSGIQERLLEIHPYTTMKRGAFTLLHDQLEYTQRPGNERVLHYGLQSVIHVSEPAGRPTVSSVWHALTGYGFLVVMHWIDMLWRVYSRGKLYTERDVRAHYVVHTYNRSYVPGPSFWDRLWNRSTLPVHSGRNTVVYRPPEQMGGLELARYMVGTHEKQTWGAWWFVFIFGLYYWFALPWWNLLSLPGVSVAIRPVLGPINVTLYLLNSCVLLFGASQSLHVPQYFILVVLFPLYLTLYPLFWAYARMHRPINTLF